MNTLQFYTATDIDEVLNFPKLVEALRTGFTEPYTVPQRLHLNYDNQQDHIQNTLLLMPAVKCGEVAGVKIVNVAVGNSKRELSTIQGVYYVLDATTGVPMALMDAKSLTNWRTAAASALAASYLALKNASSLLMVGTGSLAPFIIEAYLAVRPIDKLMIFGRQNEKSQSIATQNKGRFKEIAVVENLEQAVRQADIISVATLSSVPLIKGHWLKPGQHIDLVGAFKPGMRESDDEVMIRSNIYVDSLEMAPKEAGDLAIPLANGVISFEDIQGDLFQLCQNKIGGRNTDDEITVFKSVGHALEDLVAARLILKERKAITPK